MAQTIANLVSEVKKSRYSLIPHLSEEGENNDVVLCGELVLIICNAAVSSPDILSVWDGVSEHVEKQMLHQKVGNRALGPNHFLMFGCFDLFTV